jgi:hypothetical protein
MLCVASVVQALLVYASIHHSFMRRSCEQPFRFLAVLSLVAKEPKGYLVIVVGKQVFVHKDIFVQACPQVGCFIDKEMDIPQFVPL